MVIPHIILGTTREHYIMLFGAAAVIGLLSGFVGSWIGGYLGARRLGRTAAQAGPTLSTEAVRLEPVMHALDAIALEVERISEAQRFTTRILAERPSALLPVREPRSITPH